jgi:hypothetical protein
MTTIIGKTPRKAGLHRRPVRSTYQPVPFWDRYERSSGPLVVLSVITAGLATAAAGLVVGVFA